VEQSSEDLIDFIFFKASSFQSTLSVYNSIHFFQLLPCGVNCLRRETRVAEALKHSASSGCTTVTYTRRHERGHATQAEAGGGGGRGDGSGGGQRVRERNEKIGGKKREEKGGGARRRLSGSISRITEAIAPREKYYNHIRYHRGNRDNRVRERARCNIRRGETEGTRAREKEKEKKNSRDPNESDMAVTVAWRTYIVMHDVRARKYVDFPFLFFFFPLLPRRLLIRAAVAFFAITMTCDSDSARCPLPHPIIVNRWVNCE